MTLEEKFLNIKSKFEDGFTTAAELNGLNFKNYEISRLREKGYLVRIRQGIYKVKYPETTEQDIIGETVCIQHNFAPPVNKAKLITKVIPEAVFCYNYAWCICWGKERFPKTIHIAVPRNISRSKCKPIEGVDLVVHYLPEDLYRQDVVYGDLPHYNTERTICDLFKYHRFKSERWLSDTLREYVELIDSEKIDKLIACAEKLYLDGESKELMDRFLWRRAAGKGYEKAKAMRRKVKPKATIRKTVADKSPKKIPTVKKKETLPSDKKILEPVISAAFIEAEADHLHFLKSIDEETNYKVMKRFDEPIDPDNFWYSDDDEDEDIY